MGYNLQSNTFDVQTGVSTDVCTGISEGNVQTNDIISSFNHASSKVCRADNVLTLKWQSHELTDLQIALTAMKDRQINAIGVQIPLKTNWNLAFLNHCVHLNQIEKFYSFYNMDSL